jgi:aspartate kinase
MPLLVQKFGGTSVATIEKIRLVAHKIKRASLAGNQLIIVVSAMGHYTDELVSMAKQISHNPQKREYDVLLAAGEQITVALLSMMLLEIGCNAESFLGFQVPIITNDMHSKATIMEIPQTKIRQALAANKIVVIAGFQGVTKNNNISTLGRGGSDTSAVALAAALQADECQIYTDVDGVYTVDPNIVSNARKMLTVSFQEMLELASLGANVLQMRAVEHASRERVPLRVLSTFSENAGTLITHEEYMLKAQIISGIAISKNEAKIQIVGLPDQPFVIGKIFQALSNVALDFDMITQTKSASCLTDLVFTVARDDLVQALEILRPLANKLGATKIDYDQSLAKLSIVGLGLRTNTGIASKMFALLGDADVGIHLISSSEIKISVLISENFIEMAAKILAENFELSSKNVI